MPQLRKEVEKKKYEYLSSHFIKQTLWKTCPQRVIFTFSASVFLNNSAQIEHVIFILLCAYDNYEQEKQNFNNISNRNNVFVAVNVIIFLPPKTNIHKSFSRFDHVN